jgi:hypothetical protein
MNREHGVKSDGEPTAKRVVKRNEKFNVPDQTEEQEAETHENAEVEHLVEDKQ